MSKAVLVITTMLFCNYMFSQSDISVEDSVGCDNMFDMEQQVGYILGYVEILSTKKNTLNSMYFCFIKDVPNEIKKLSKFKKINNYNSTLYYFRSEKLQKLLKEKIENETIYDVLCYQAINNLRNSNVMSFSFSRNIYTNKCWDDKFDEKIAFETDSILSNLVGFFLLFHLDYIEKTGGYFIYQKVNIEFLKVKTPDVEDFMYKSYIISKYEVDGKKTYKINREKEIYVVTKKVKNDSIVIIPYKVDILKN